MDLEAYATYMTWWWYDAFKTIPLEHWRQGFVIVSDMTGMTWENYEFDREYHLQRQAVLNKFPIKIYRHWVINPNFLWQPIKGFNERLFGEKCAQSWREITEEELKKKNRRSCTSQVVGGYTKRRDEG
eukprot:TRINITY_DN3606_c0_g1_i1.p1 TRINITY_DN3606_c0_g1~~TRINITY_DN3606_c0_g1_i1.p1  ORF type:complete len:128 (+),score=11.49 TRINITY_DN3606_c0_g1_i1:481-864(+)